MGEHAPFPPARPAPTSGQMLALSALVHGGMLLGAAFVAWWLELRWASPTLSGVVVGVVATLPTILCIPWMLRSSWAPLVELRRDLLEDIAPDLVRGPWPLLVFISVSAGIGEEALFRGALQVWSAGWIGLIPAIVSSALVFGLMHPFSWVYIGMAAVVGAWWGVVMVASGQLAAAMIAHALHDIVAMFALRWRLDEHLAPRWARSWLGLPPRGAARRS